MVALLGGIALVFAVWQFMLVRGTVEAHDAHLLTVEGRLAQTVDLTDDEIAALRRSTNAAHVSAARARGIEPVPARAALEDSAASGGLVPLESDARILFLDATHSIYRATPGTAIALDSIAVRFDRELEARDLPRFRFTVSSLLRSTEDQANLSGVNVNAVRDRSSHEYGTTFDITYRRFDLDGGATPVTPPLPDRLAAIFAQPLRQRLKTRQDAFYDDLAVERAPALAAILGRVLIGLENDGVLLALRERRQPVYHVTETVSDAQVSTPAP